MYSSGTASSWKLQTKKFMEKTAVQAVIGAVADLAPQSYSLLQFMKMIAVPCFIDLLL
eukprot:gene3401-13444_t